MKYATGFVFRRFAYFFVDIFILFGFGSSLLLYHKPKALLQHAAIAGNYSMEEILDNNLQDDAEGNEHNNGQNKHRQQSEEERETDALKRWESFSKSVNSGSLVVEK